MNLQNMHMANRKCKHVKCNLGQKVKKKRKEKSPLKLVVKSQWDLPYHTFLSSKECTSPYFKMI